MAHPLRLNLKVRNLNLTRLKIANPFEKVNYSSFKAESVLKTKFVNEHNSERHLNVNELDVLETKPSLVLDHLQSRESILGVTHKIASSNFESNYVSETRCNDTLFNSLHKANAMDVAHAGTVSQSGARNTSSFKLDSQIRNSVTTTNE